MSFNPIVAKLLSTENLTVMQANIPTACFDVKDRVLLIPNLLPEYDDAYGMLTAHEVGHALFTTQEFNEIFIAASSTMKQYYNICEDVRVEKLIKRKYPGLRRVMAEGYEIFNSNNYFLPSNVDVNTLTLIDRINAYFKIGHICGVYFTPEERLLAEEVENTESISDVIIVAKKIFDFVKAQLTKQPEQKKKEKAEPKEQSESDDNDEFGNDKQDAEDEKSGTDKSDDEKSSQDDTTEESDKESNQEKTEKSEQDAEQETESINKSFSMVEDENKVENDSNSGDEPKLTGEEVDRAMQSVTQNALDGGLKDATDTKTKVKNFTLETDFAKDPIYSYKHMLNNMGDTALCYYCDIGTQLANSAPEFEKFISSTNRVVAHMVKEFEMKKCAHKQRRAQVSKTGQLNVNKLFAYKIKDELFKSITTIADDKNHGMIFLVDWSGSMSQHLKDTLCQLMSLTMFCRKAKIPFSVLAFSDRTWNENVSDHAFAYKILMQNAHIAATKNDVLISDAGYNLQLLELMTDKMNEQEFTRMLKLLYSGVVQSIYSLGGTPLNQSLVYMHSYVAKYKKMNNIEKLTFTVLTDGQGDTLRYKDGTSTLGIGWTSGSICKVVDPITKDVYDISRPTTTITLLKMIKKSAQCQVIGFYVCKSRDLYSALNGSFPNEPHQIRRQETAKADFRKNGYSIQKNCGYDKLYLINASDLGENEYVPKYDEDMSAASLAKEMTKQNTATVSNKLLMGKVIGEFSIGISA